MRFRRWQIAVAVIALLVLSGTTVLAIAKLDVIRGYFAGDTSRLEQDIYEPRASVADENFRVTLEQSLADDFNTVLIYSVEALNAQAQKELFDEDFRFMLPDAIKYESDGQIQESRGIGYELTDYNTENKRYRVLHVMGKEQLGEAAVLETIINGADGRPLTIPLPVGNQLDTYEIPINLYTNSDDPCLVYKVGISNISLLVESEKRRFERLNVEEIYIFFRLKDGSLITKNQLVANGGINGIVDGERSLVTQRFATVLDLEEIELVIVCDMEFPLRGGEPTPFVVAPAMKEVVIGPIFAADWQAVPLAAVCEALGAAWDYDEKNDVVTVEYRGTKLVVDLGKNSWEVDGERIHYNPEKYYFIEEPDGLYWEEDELLIRLNIFEIVFHVDFWLQYTERAYESENSVDYMEEEGRYYRIFS